MPPLPALSVITELACKKRKLLSFEDKQQEHAVVMEQRGPAEMIEKCISLWNKTDQTGKDFFGEGGGGWRRERCKKQAVILTSSRASFTGFFQKESERAGLVKTVANGRKMDDII